VVEKISRNVMVTVVEDPIIRDEIGKVIMCIGCVSQVTDPEPGRFRVRVVLDFQVLGEAGHVRQGFVGLFVRSAAARLCHLLVFLVLDHVAPVYSKAYLPLASEEIVLVM
jgi:hypothetical protein